MDKQQFSQLCYQQLVSIFEQAKSRKKVDIQKHRTEGFIQAGKVLGLLSEHDAIDLMEKAHIDVYGLTIAERKAKSMNLREAIERGDDDFINIPAYERNKPTK